MTKALRIILYLNFEINGTFNQCTFEPPPLPLSPSHWDNFAYLQNMAFRCCIPLEIFFF